jgi:hypothetical protein
MFTTTQRFSRRIPKKAGGPRIRRHREVLRGRVASCVVNGKGARIHRKRKAVFTSTFRCGRRHKCAQVLGAQWPCRARWCVFGRGRHPTRPRGNSAVRVRHGTYSSLVCLVRVSRLVQTKSRNVRHRPHLSYLPSLHLYTIGTNSRRRPGRVWASNRGVAK